MPIPSSIEESKSVKKRSAKGAKAGKLSKDSDKKAEQSLIDVEASVHHGDANESEQSLIADDTSDTVREDQTFGQGKLKNVNECLKGKVGTDILAKHWLKDCKLSSLERSMVILRLAYELCLAKDPDYDLENEAAENNKKNNFDTKRIFHILEYVTAKISPEDCKKFTEFICQSGNVKLLEMICRQENEGSKVRVNQQYPWKGEFTGYERLTDLLQYVLKEECYPEIVLCIAKKVYGNAHVIYNGERYLDSRQIAQIKGSFNYQDSVIKDCLKAAIKLGYKDVVPVMLSGDIYHCIRLMKGEKFQEEFSEALDMIEEVVAEVMSSWVNCNQDLLEEVQGLLKEGIEIGIEKMGKKELIDELESRGIELSREDKKGKVGELRENLKGEEVKLRLSKAVVGGLISTLFFNYQKELTELVKNEKPFKIEPSPQDDRKKGKEIDELNENIDKKDFLEKKVLEKIKSLNSISHAFNNWFSREVLSAIVNGEERFYKLKAVCVATCKEKVEESLEGAKVHEDVVDTLKFFGVDFSVLKSNVVANIPSLQIEDLTLSSNSGSEKSTSNELRQPSADAELTSDDCSSTSRDPLKINITGPERVAKAKVLSPALPGSKAVEKKDKGFMQSNCGQGENSSYNKGKNSHRHGGKVGSISGGLGMLSGINFQVLDKKKQDASATLRTRKLLGKTSRQMNAYPPSIEQLLDANQMMYMEKALDKVILNYDTLSYNGLYESSLLDCSLDESSSEEAQELYELFESSDNFTKYENAVDKLVKGNVVAAKRMLLELVNDVVQPACYAYVVVFFKEVMRQCDVLNTIEENVKVMEGNKDEIIAATQLLKRANLMEPANSFLLGMIKRYNIGECNKFIDRSWKDDLIHVVNVARDYGFLNIEQYILKGINCDNKWDHERCGLGMQKKGEYIKEMGKYSLYELTLSMSSERHLSADILNDLFQILPQDGFPEVLYSYGAALLQTRVGTTFKENIEEAIRLLNLAALEGHEGAKFLLGNLLFNNKVSCRLTQDEIKRYVCGLEDYINSSDGSCTINEKNIDKAAHCLAVEYYAKKSRLVQPNKQKAEKILDSRNLHKELHELQSLVGQSFTLSDSSTVSPSFLSEETFSPLFSSSKAGSPSSGCATMLDDDSKLGSIPKTDFHSTSTEKVNDSLLTK